MPPAPLPMIVWVPECSEVKEIAFSVPLTHSGLSNGSSFGLTINPLSQDAINFIAELLAAAFFISLLISCIALFKLFETV